MDDYDSIFANYVDARKKMNELRLARGFYPVVALGPDGQQSNLAAQASGKGKSKGAPASSSAKGKSKGKGKSKPSARSGPGPSSAKGRAASVRGDSTCLRCGQKGHWARNCPKAAQGQKRGRDDPDAMVAYVCMVTDDI